MSLGETFRVDCDSVGEVRIGRAPDVDRIIDAPSVGRHVLAFRIEAGRFVMADLGSGSGSMMSIDGELVIRPCCEVPDHALLWIGNVCFELELRNAQDSIAS